MARRNFVTEVCDGWVEKRANNKKKWLPWWVVLRGHRMFFFHDADTSRKSNLVGHVELTGSPSTCAMPVEMKQSFGFHVVGLTGVYWFRTATLADRDRWVLALRTALAQVGGGPEAPLAAGARRDSAASKHPTAASPTMQLVGITTRASVSAGSTNGSGVSSPGRHASSASQRPLPAAPREPALQSSSSSSALLPQRPSLPPPVAVAAAPAVGGRGHAVAPVTAAKPAGRPGRTALPPPPKLAPYEQDNLGHGPWYFGPTARGDAEYIIERLGSPGSFLIRSSESDPGSYSLSVMDEGQVKHYRISRSPSGSLTLAGTKGRVFTSLEQLVTYFVGSQGGYASPMDRKQVSIMIKAFDPSPSAGGGGGGGGAAVAMPADMLLPGQRLQLEAEAAAASKGMGDGRRRAQLSTHA